MDKTKSDDLTLLLVEDDDIDAEGVVRAFAKNEIPNPIIRANNGFEALELLETERFEKPYLILLDLNMPRMGGIEFLKVLRQHPHHHSAVVFVLTTSNADKDIMASYDEHVSGYFVKHNDGFSMLDIVRLFDVYRKSVTFPPMGRKRA